MTWTWLAGSSPRRLSVREKRCSTCSKLNFAHCYLPASFISPISNRRRDAYGGSVAARMRFRSRSLRPSERCGRGTGRSPWRSRRRIGHLGLPEHEAIQVAAMVKSQGVNVLRVLAGQTTALESPGYGRFYLMPFSDRIRNDVGIRTIASGKLTTADEVKHERCGGARRISACSRQPEPTCGTRD